jgi:PEP-CTERM motif
MHLRNAVVFRATPVAIAVILSSSIVRAFTPGDIVLMRGGDATHSESTFNNGEVPAYLDEYTPAGVLVGSTPIDPTVLTLPGVLVNSHEGRLELSGNGQFLDFAGYQQATSATTPRVTDNSGGAGYYQVGQISATGVFTHTALDPTVAKPQFIRGAYSNDGTQAWVASKNPTGGLEYISGLGSASPTTVALQSTTDWRDLKVVDGQLYGGTGSSSVGTHGFYAIGTGSPTSGTPANTLLTNSSDNTTSSFSFVTLPGGNPADGHAGSPNTVYIVGSPAGSNYIGKLSSGGAPLTTGDLQFAGGSRLALTASNYTGGEPEGLIARIDPTNPTWVDLFLNDTSGVYFAIDKSGSATGSISALSFTKIISTTADTAFYGIASAPSPVPEPSTLALLAVGGLVAGVAVRRRASATKLAD